MAARDYPESWALAERIAKLEAEYANVKADVLEIKADVKAILAQLNQQSGGRKALWSLLAAAATLGGLVSALIGWLIPHPH